MVDTVLERKPDVGTEEERYDLNRVMGRRFFEDCLLFDMANEGRIVSGRAPVCRLRIGESFLGFLSESDRERLRGFLFGYPTERSVLVLDTEIGIAIILPTLMPSSAIGVALIPDMERRAVLRLIGRSEGLSVILEESLAAEGQRRMRGDEKARAEVLERIFADVERCFWDPRARSLSEGADMTSLLKSRVLRWSDFVGCPVLFGRIDPLLAVGAFDFSLFDACVWMMLCLCRRLSPDRSATVSLTRSSDVAAVTVKGTLDGEGHLILSEAEWLNEIAAKKNMVFEWAVDAERFYLRFAPINRDWAYLGLKQPTIFDWMRV